MRTQSGGQSTVADTDKADARLVVVERQKRLIKAKEDALKVQNMTEKGMAGNAAAAVVAPAEEQGLPKEFFIVMAALFALVLAIGALIAWVIITYFSD